MRGRPRLTWVVVAALSLAACGTPKGVLPGAEQTFPPEAEVPQLQGVSGGGTGGESAASVLGEEQVTVGEAAPPGLHITSFPISPTTLALVDAIHFTGFKSGGPGALIELPVSGLNERQNIYYAIIPVINEGKEAVRNLKGRIDFFDKAGRLIWTETEALTHLPTRLGLNPPSLPNQVDPQPELSKEASNYPLYFFPTNVGLFVVGVPDPEVSKKIRSWTLTFLVSTT